MSRQFQFAHGKFNLLTAISICLRQFQFAHGNFNLLTAISICLRQFQFAHGNFNLLTAISICSRQFQFAYGNFNLLTAISICSRQFQFAHGNFNLLKAISICSRQYTILLMSRSQCLMGLTEWLPVLRGGIASFRITNKNLTMKSSAKCVRSKEEAEKIVTNCVSHEEVCKNLKVEELKNYLRDRGLNLSGNKAELSKKAFGSVKLGISKCSTSKEDYAVKEKEKRERLSLESGLIQLPSPLNLKEGWQAGSLYFPNTIESDVEDYLKVHGPKSMVKGSSLLTSKHVVDAAVHNISPNVRYCYVRGRCVPQERTNNPPYEAWVCLQKDDGSVVTGECSCVAG